MGVTTRSLNEKQVESFNRGYEDHWHLTIHHGGSQKKTSEGAAKPEYEYLGNNSPAQTWLRDFVLAAPKGLRLCLSHTRFTACHMALQRAARPVASDDVAVLSLKTTPYLLTKSKRE